LKSFRIIHDLPSGPIPVEILTKEIPTGLVKTDHKATRKACESCGAFGKNWGCPPYSPRFERIAQDKLLVVCAKIPVKSYPKTVLSSHSGIKMLFSETFLKPLTDKWGRALAESEHGMFLSSGNCRACRKCAKKEGKRCRSPERRTFSLEATGVLVTQLVEDVFGFPLQWWGRESTPEYMCKVVAVTF
jgi:predicted metal-binding protein